MISVMAIVVTGRKYKVCASVLGCVLATLIQLHTKTVLSNSSLPTCGCVRRQRKAARQLQRHQDMDIGDAEVCCLMSRLPAFTVFLLTQYHVTQRYTCIGVGAET